MNLNPTTPAMVVKPVGEHRKLLKSTGPILNYVFDHHPPYYKSTYYNTSIASGANGGVHCCPTTANYEPDDLLSTFASAGTLTVNHRATSATMRERRRYGPHFETDNVTNITVQNGDTLFLSCRISLLQDKTVSWVRRKSGDTALQLLTVGKQTYSGDSRYQIEFQYPNNWRLKISRANKNDEGVYECQISTHPPKVIIYYLYVNGE
uniref:Ig-like domain-containing protein n=1 Tax=Anopheles culicifacies TaxID=139723 RepID=A0A182M052_9DIPT